MNDETPMTGSPAAETPLAEKRQPRMLSRLALGVLLGLTLVLWAQFGWMAPVILSVLHEPPHEDVYTAVEWGGGGAAVAGLVLAVVMVALSRRIWRKAPLALHILLASPAILMAAVGTVGLAGLFVWFLRV